MKLFSRQERHQERVALYQKLQQHIRGFIKQAIPRTAKKRKIVEPSVGRLTYQKPFNYEKPLGSKGYKNLDDYLIPIIKLMWSGMDHREAFNKIAHKLDVRSNTVSSQCTRVIGLTTAEFVSQVNSRKIVDLLERKYPDKRDKIKAELKK